MSVDNRNDDINEIKIPPPIRINTVPWCNAFQFKKVYEFLYSDELIKKKWAYDTISVWETRCYPSLPTAIEATYVLTSAVIQDILWTNKASLVHYTDLQGIYGSAITRFVSLSVEVNKNKGHSSYSIAEVAKSIGMPSFIVDIRNEICHSGRPSLSILRLAAQSALKYLKESYWEKEATHVNNYVKQPLDESKLMVLFKEFIKFQENTIEKLIKYDDMTMKINPEYVKLMFKIESYLKQNKRFFIKVLVSDGIFIPFDKDFKEILPEEEFLLFESSMINDFDSFEEDEDSVDNAKVFLTYEDLKKCMLPELPECHEVLWEPIISILNKYDSVPLFMESLLRSQGDRTNKGQKLIISWILKIMRIHTSGGSTEKSCPLKKIFRRKAIVANWHSMFYSAVINPCRFTPVVIPLLLHHLNKNQAVIQRIINTLAIFLGFYKDDKQDQENKRFHTVEDLKRVLEYQRNNHSGKPAESIWSPCPDDCHKSWPIGSVINAIEDAAANEEQMETSLDCYDEDEENDRILPCNKNDDYDDDDDEDDELGKNNKEPDLKKIMQEIKKRQYLLYKKSG